MKIANDIAHVANEISNNIAQVSNENHNDISQITNENHNDIGQVANENCLMKRHGNWNDSYHKDCGLVHREP